MIHLYLYQNSDFNNELSNRINTLLNDDDLIICNKNHFLLDLKKENIISEENVNFEKLSSQKINNLGLFFLNKLSTTLIEKIIILKSKKSEIFGFSLCEQEVVDFLNEIQYYKDIGLSQKEISLLSSIKYNFSNIVFDKYFERLIFQNSKIKQIKELKDLVTLNEYWKKGK